MNHIDQEAELYALGMLEDQERARIDEHIAACDACAALVGKAESTVAGLIDASQRRELQTRRSWWPAAIAAAFALTAAGLLGQNVALHGALSNDGTVFATMVNSHFNHTQFQTSAGSEVAVKAIYERHGKWIEVLADGAPHWHIVLVRPDGTRNPAASSFISRGAASVAYLAPAMPVRRVDLEDEAGHVVASARLVLEKESADL